MPFETPEVEVSYSFSRDDYQHFFDFVAKRNRRKHLRRIVVEFLWLFACLVAIFLLSNLPAPFAVGSGAFVAIVGTSLVQWTKRRRMKRVREEWFGERTTRIGPDGVFGQFAHSETLSYWEGIRDLAESDGYFFLFTSGSNAHIVPKRSFASRGDIEQFREAARTYWQLNRYNSSMERPERRIVLAGESPARVSAGAPGSRLRSRGEIRAARRSDKSPCKRGEQISGLQQSVNAIASSNYQPKGVWESRAAHVTAKATDSIPDRNEYWICPGSQAAAR